MPKDDWLKLAILYDEHATYSPSNPQAIDNFCEAAIYRKMYPSIITSDHLDTLENYDALLIRDTTQVNHYTQDFSVIATQLNIPVIDTPAAILLGCSKTLQFANFKYKDIPHPKTYVLSHFNYDRITLTYPQVIKIPDSCFSQGVYLAHDRDEYINLAENLLCDNRQLLTQEFIKTEYDWRICVFQKKILFACKYYVCEDDWKIVKYDRKGEIVEGNHECVRDVPPELCAIVEQCYSFLDNSLYGIDIKEYAPCRYVVIEINDNPSIDAEVEDGLMGMKIYDTIIQSFKKYPVSKTG